jgi:hypothetical protein
VLFYLTERPEEAGWLSDDDRLALVEALRRDASDGRGAP